VAGKTATESGGENFEPPEEVDEDVGREFAIAANLQVAGGKAPINVCINISRRLQRSLEMASRAGHIWFKRWL
jgi:hypothetical protein